MIVNIVNSDTLFSKKAWSVNFLLPQEKIEVSKEYSLIPISQLAFERRERITPTEELLEINYIGLENIEQKTGRLVDFFVKEGKEIKSASKLFKKGDVLLGRLRPNLNKVFYNDVFESGVCSTEIIVLIPNSNLVNPIYFSELLRSEPVNRRIVSMIKGASLPRVSGADLRQLQLPIPPLSEQEKIVEIIVEKRRSLEEHIKRAKEIPFELSELLSAAYI